MTKKKKSSKSKVIRRQKTFRLEKDLTVCLIAGGAGFIGSYLCEQLLSQNCFVYCLDNFSTGRKENLNHLSSKANFQVIDKDLNEVKKISLPHEPDYIFHLAGVEAYINGVDINLDTLLVNSFGTKNLLNLANEAGAKFLLGSSVQVHSGFLSDTNLKEYFGQTRGRQAEGVFNEAKRFSEALTAEYGSKYNLDARVVRLGFLYGPRMNLDSGSILGSLIKQALKKKPLTVFGDGLTKIYPTFISDAIYGVIKAMFSQSSKGKIYTLMNPETATLLNIAYTLRDLIGQNLEIEHLAGREEIEKPFLIEKELLKSQEGLGWHPKVNYKSGLGETLNWFKKQSVGVGLVSTRKKKATLKDQKSTEITERFQGPLRQLADQRLSVAQKVSEPPLAKVRKTQSSILSFLKAHVARSREQVEKSHEPRATSHEPKRLLSFKTLILGLSFSLLLLVFILSPFLLLAFFGVKGAKNLERTSTAFKEKNWLEIKPRAINAKTSFIKAQQTLQIIDSVFGGLGFSQKIQPVSNLLETGENVSRSIEHLWEAGNHAQELSSIILGQKVGDSKTLISQIQIELNRSNELLGFAQSQLHSEKTLFEEFDLDEKYKLLSSQIPRWRQGLYLAQTALAVLPDVLSLENKKTYLLLLQNNHELRPTGGFIGSYGLITFEKGKLLDFEIEDVYTADGQLKGHIEPPKEIKKYLGEAAWFLRDSNFSPDFPTSAARAAWFLEKETARKVDGVIGINLYLIQNILKVTGPILVPDYNEQITADNVFERGQYHSEVNFFPGSTQKKDFLSSLTTQLFEKLKTIQTHQFPGIAVSFLDSFEQRAIMACLPAVVPYLQDAGDSRSDTNSSRILAQLGWDGALRTLPVGLPKFPQETFGDFLMVNEANFGVNKANFFVKRSIVAEATIDGKNGQVMGKTTLSIKNNSPSEAWPGGTYKNYLRFLLPAESELFSVKTSAKSNDLPENKISLKKIEQSFEAGKKSIGLLIEVPSKEERKVEITYKLNKAIDLTKKEFTYLFYWQKQPGIGDDPIKLIINYPVFLKPTKLSQETTLKKGTISFDSTLEKDRIFAIAFEH